ncbi:MAG: hypothetical protein ABIG64_08400 [Candidatus Omnitrophota bacterium]
MLRILKKSLNKKAFTLMELQIASFIMIAVLLVTGVLFYFALASLRYMHDGFEVIYNANMVMKVISQEVMISNCYGSTQGPTQANLVLGLNPNEHFYGNRGYQHRLTTGLSASRAWEALFATPTLQGQNTAWADTIFLRQALQNKTGFVATGDPENSGNFFEHDAVVIFRDAATNDVWIDRSSNNNPNNIDFVAANPGNGMRIATHIEALEFWPIEFNCVGVRITARGRIPNPLPGQLQYFELVLGRFITLRCAPQIAPVSWNGAQNMW